MIAPANAGLFFERCEFMKKVVLMISIAIATVLARAALIPRRDPAMAGAGALPVGGM